MIELKWGTCMIISLLFNWRLYPADANYWHVIQKEVFSPGIIQRSNRQMKVSIGDVLVGFEYGVDRKALFFAAFGNSEFSLIEYDRLIEGFPTIFGIVFENMTQELAYEVHNSLLSHDGYIGAISVHFEFGPHIALYRSALPLQYRLQGTRLRSFYPMGDKDGRDEYDLERMKKFGYIDVAFEDTGAYRTILDDFDTPRHFKRVATFRRMLTISSSMAEDDAYHLTMLLEDLSPKLFNAL
ncbi:MAG TPA: hypothetical protein PKE65_07640, partial [Rhizobiaceae bacterium]|nr:hypothetical protein [Rhizobiaceae bacterium]